MAASSRSSTSASPAASPWTTPSSTPPARNKRTAAAGGTYTARGGTIAYMAPEQFVTGQSSVQSDIFALGLILYELATGRHPFHRPDAPEFQSIRAIQFADPPSLREINPALPHRARKRHPSAAWKSSPPPASPPPLTSAKASKPS